MRGFCSNDALETDTESHRGHAERGGNQSFGKCSSFHHRAATQENSQRHHAEAAAERRCAESHHEKGSRIRTRVNRFISWTPILCGTNRSRNEANQSRKGRDVKSNASVSSDDAHDCRLCRSRWLRNLTHHRLIPRFQGGTESTTYTTRDSAHSRRRSCAFIPAETNQDEN